MKVHQTDLPGVLYLAYDFHLDDRGWFVETFDARSFEKIGLPTDWPHDSWSLSRSRGTVRGLHYQRAPRAQAKLVRVPHGRVLDVALDIRPTSTSFGEHIGIELNSGGALYIPEGFAHGFCTLTDDTEVVYKMSDTFSAPHAGGIAWDDPEINIRWPVEASEATLSPRDQGHPTLRDAERRSLLT